MILRLHFVCTVLALLLGVSAYAQIQRIDVASRSELSAHDRSAAYIQVRGVAYGEIDPAAPENTVITDIALAPRNVRGHVAYAATFTLEMPADPSHDSGLLIYEVVNRGASIIPRDYTRGDIFLRSGWQGDLPFRGRSIYGTEAETIDVPFARHADGTPVTGAAVFRFSNVRGRPRSLATADATGYVSSGTPPQPADLDTSHARLISRRFESVDGVTGGEQLIPAEAWSWADCSVKPFPGTPSGSHVCLRDGFDPALSYTLSFQARDPKVLGIGLAAIRDAADFFSRAKSDEDGHANPVARRVRASIVEGASQSGNLIRTFLNLDFNRTLDGHRLFAGAMVMIAARQTPINLRFAVPGGASTLYEPGSDGAVWWSDWTDRVRGLGTIGLLHRCRASGTCPKIVEVLGSSEFWSLRGSPDFVGTDDRADIPLPAEVRRYYIAGTSHGGGAGGFDWKPTPYPTLRPESPANPIAGFGCVMAVNPNPEREINAALLEDLKAWVSQGTAPPRSQYPRLSDGQLVPATRAAIGMPTVPGMPSPDGVANPLLVYDFGAGFHAADLSGAMDREPPAITGVIYPMVPRVNVDGNETSGVETVLQQAPLGTYTGWNITVAGFNKGQYCSLNGGYVPFARTREERRITHDPRLSLEERYGTRRGYLCAVNRASRQLVAERLLLPEDAAAMSLKAAALPELPTDDAATADAKARATKICGNAEPRR